MRNRAVASEATTAKTVGPRLRFTQLLGGGMDKHVSFLISILYDMTIVKVAVAIDKSLLSSDTLEYHMEESSREELHKHLPLHVQTMGPIVDVEYIFNVSVVESPST
jgi:hypothetical protein